MSRFLTACHPSVVARPVPVRLPIRAPRLGRQEGPQGNGRPLTPVRPATWLARAICRCLAALGTQRVGAFDP